MAGLDKFFHLPGELGHVSRSRYWVAIKPRIGAYVVCAWLRGIVTNLPIVPGFFDIALCDFGLALGALALGRLSQEFSS